MAASTIRMPRRLLARERPRGRSRSSQELEALRRRAQQHLRRPRAKLAAAAAIAADAAAEAAPPPSDEPWIETTRCPSCNECQNINDRMFGYNDNKQAYIKDLSAGTFRQIVEAAEACQVAIIHPGKPRNPERSRASKNCWSARSLSSESAPNAQ